MKALALAKKAHLDRFYSMANLLIPRIHHSDRTIVGIRDPPTKPSYASWFLVN